MRASGTVGSRPEPEPRAAIQSDGPAEEKRSLAPKGGQTMVEYGMLLILVAAAVLLLSASIKPAILGVFQNATNMLK